MTALEPVGPFWTMLDRDRSTGCDDTLPVFVSIHDGGGNVVEDLGRSLGNALGRAALAHAKEKTK